MQIGQPCFFSFNLCHDLLLFVQILFLLDLSLSLHVGLLCHHLGNLQNYFNIIPRTILKLMENSGFFWKSIYFPSQLWFSPTSLLLFSPFLYLNFYLICSYFLPLLLLLFKNIFDPWVQKSKFFHPRYVHCPTYTYNLTSGLPIIFQIRGTGRYEKRSRGPVSWGSRKVWNRDKSLWECRTQKILGEKKGGWKKAIGWKFV